MVETFLQNAIFTRFAFPFILIFFVVYAILQKTKLLGDDKHQINAVVSAVVGLIVVAVAYPVLVISNMILFLSVALVVVLVGLMLWGFATGGDMGKDFMTKPGIKWAAGIVIVAAVVIALIWATGINNSVIDFLFKQSWSESLWTNIVFVALIIAVIVVAWKSAKVVKS